MLGQDQDGSEWSSLMPQAIDLRLCNPAISPCEQLCVTVSEAFLGLDVLVSVFSVAQRCWLFEYLLRDATCPLHGVTFSRSSSPLLACVQLNAGQLLVLSLHPPSARSIQTGGARLIDCQPRADCIILLRRGSLAVIDTASWREPASVIWEPLPAAGYELSGCLDCAAAGQAVWVARVARSVGNRQFVQVSVHSMSDAVCQGTWHLEGPWETHSLCVRASCRALAIWGYSTTCVYQQTARFQLG